jgi:hypothetical protein
MTPLISGAKFNMSEDLIDGMISLHGMTLEEFSWDMERIVCGYPTPDFKRIDFTDD